MRGEKESLLENGWLHEQKRCSGRWLATFCAVFSEKIICSLFSCSETSKTKQVGPVVRSHFFFFFLLLLLPPPPPELCFGGLTTFSFRLFSVFGCVGVCVCVCVSVCVCVCVCLCLCVRAFSFPLSLLPSAFALPLPLWKLTNITLAAATDGTIGNAQHGAFDLCNTSRKQKNRATKGGVYQI